MARRPPDDAMFVVPPARFTAERKRLAAELRAAGDGPAAKAMEKLRKPTLALWAANQAVRADRAGVDRLLQSVDRLQASSSGRSVDLRQALAHQRETLAALLAHARRALESIGARVTPEVTGRISATLTAAAVDRAARADLLAGRLTDERAAPGFEVFGDAPVARPRRGPTG
jgi:hypothetical protein